MFATRPFSGPVVVILRLTAEIDQRIDRRGSAERAAARHRNAAAAEIDLWFALVIPVDRPVMVDAVDAGRYLHHQPPVRRPGLEQQNGDIGIFAQARGENAARRSATDDRIVVTGLQVRHKILR